MVNHPQRSRTNRSGMSHFDAAALLPESSRLVEWNTGAGWEVWEYGPIGTIDGRYRLDRNKKGHWRVTHVEGLRYGPIYPA
jgi:hypothetical protein